MRHLEDGIQQAIFNYLTLVAPHLVIFHPANGGRRNAREAARLKSMGVVPGIPDIIIIGDDGKAFCLEIKADYGKRKGRLSETQKEVHQKLANLGAPVMTVYGIDGVKRALATWGIATRESILTP